MAQVFPSGCNVLARAMLGGAGLLAVAVPVTLYVVYWSPFMTGAGEAVHQPVPFSHKHHAAELGIDCRYCHAGVEEAAFAGMPATETCMTCHSQIWRDAPMLEPVRKSWTSHHPLHWRRVNDLPDYVYFNHSIHVIKGVACVECHGPVGEMALTAQGTNLTMRWCLDCHRSPAGHFSQPAAVFAAIPAQQRQSALPVPGDLADDIPRLEDCSICHR